MIDEIRLNNFKCFPEIEMPLSEMTILTGANASGKSTIVQALLLLFATMREKGDSVDVGDAMNIEIGSPQALIAQNPTELSGADFMIGLTCGANRYDVQYRIDKLSPLKLLYERPEGNIEDQIFYLNAERKGPRIFYPAKSDNMILSDGSNAAYLIDRGDMQGRKISEKLSMSGVVSKFSIHVEEWMNVILDDVNLSVNVDLTKASTDIRYRNALVDQEVLPTMTGFGISYILAIVTTGLWCSSQQNAIMIVENPEAHLHPGAQSRMGKFLYLVSAAGVQVIIETHSEHVIDGVRMQAALMHQTDNVSIEFLSSHDKKIEVEKIGVHQNGELEKWPEGFFDQKTKDLRELFYMRRGNAGK